MKSPYQWLRRHLWRRRASPSLSKADLDLERYFTDCEDARTRFAEAMSAPKLLHEMLVIRGDGAVGKSSLLRMLRLDGHRKGIPVGLVGSEEAGSAVELLRRWAVDLRNDGVPFRTFEGSYRRYQELQNTVVAEARKVGASEGDAAQELVAALAKGAISVAASTVPIVGPVLGIAGGATADAVINLLRAVLSKSDLDFFLDPTGRLTEDFAADAARVSREQRIVLMLDTIEAITALREWLCSLVQRQLPEVLWVFAGQELPDWEADWPGWMGRALILELTALDDDEIRHLVRHYYGLFGRGEPDPAQVENVVRFARGLPIAATTLVRLWVNYQVGDLTHMGAGAVADMADRVLQDVPKEMRPAFEAAAVLRYFNADSLAALLHSTSTRQLYDELRRWPFTRPRSGGFAVHESMREVMNEALRQRSPGDFRSLNEAAERFYTGLVNASGDVDRERVALEALYHAVRADETSGIRRFQATAENCVSRRVLGQLRGLLNDANTWVLADESSRGWVRYYNARLEVFAHGDAVSEAVYRVIGGNESLDPRLRAYALCDLGAVLATLDRLAEPYGERRAADTVAQSLALRPELDAKLARNHVTLAHISDSKAAWQESVRHLGDLRSYAESVGDSYGIVEGDMLIAAVRGLEGDWPECLTVRQHSLDRIRQLGDLPGLTMEASYFTWPLVFAGRLNEAQRSVEEAYRLAIQLEEKELLIPILESTALALGMQDSYAAADERFTEAINFFTNFHLAAAGDNAASAERYIRATLSFRGLVSMRMGQLDAAEADLTRALEIKQAIGDRIGVPEVYAWRGQLAELRKDWPIANAAYQQVLAMSDLNRKYFEALAWSGLGRVHAALRNGAWADELRTAEELATRYEYADVLAHVHLTRGHLAWDQSDDAAADPAVPVKEAYRRALTSALQHNRYLLDEVLGGRGARGTVQAPIVAACARYGEQGRRVLESLAQWWRSTQIGAEAAARQREPGDGSPQATVLQQLTVT